MPTPQIQNDPIYSLPFLYKQGLAISNDATTPHTVLDIAAGQCRDSNDIIDMPVGNAPLDGPALTPPLLLNAAVNGYNGLDTGSLAASTLYAIYIIGDSRYYNPVGAIATLASNSLPLMPFGYDSYRLIGYWSSNSSSQWSVGYQVGSGSSISFLYDTPLATAITAGHATSYTPIDLTNLVPAIPNVVVNVYYSYTPATAGNIMSLQPTGGTGAAVVITGQVTSVATTGNANVLEVITSGKPEISYKVGNSSDTAVIDVAGFSYGV